MHRVCGYRYDTETVSVFKHEPTDPLGIELTSAPGYEHPKVTRAVGSVAGKLMIGDAVMSVQGATAAEAVESAATLAARGVPTLAIAQFLSGPHMVHPHTVHLPLGALLITCTIYGTDSLAPHLPGGSRARRRRRDRP